MQMTALTRTLSTKVVHVANDGRYTDDELIAFALQQAGETMDRLTWFGAQVQYHGDEYRVTLHTD